MKNVFELSLAIIAANKTFDDTVAEFRGLSKREQDEWLHRHALRSPRELDERVRSFTVELESTVYWLKEKAA